MTNSTTDNSLRKVAILVASLDETWADRVLANLSPQQARSVRQQVDQLTDIDPDEQNEVVAEFRRGLAQPSKSMSAGVELDPSLLERLDHDDYRPAATPQQSDPLARLSTDDVDLLATMLAAESPQTAAVVLSRLDADRAAEVLNRFSASQQNEVLERLADLDSTDEQALQVVEAQVVQWLNTQRQRRDRMAAGKQMVERLMSRKPVHPDGTVVAGRLPRAAALIATELERVSSRGDSLARPIRYEPLPTPPQAPPAPSPRVNPFAQLTASECVTRLESLPNQMLLEALSRCESRIALLSLVDVSEKLLRRVTRGLSRLENRRFRQQLRDVGPTRLSDILTAQQEVLYVASQLTRSG